MMKATTKKELVSALLLITLVLATYNVSATSATDSSISGIRIGQTMQWRVTASSEVTATWYSETFMPRGNFSVPLGSTISLTITSIADDAIRGDVSVGNLILTDVSMSEVSFNLLLGWYPFQPSLVCPVNWDVQELNATSNGFTVYQAGLTTITFTHLSGAVGTELTYDKATGILVEGYGSFGQFLIQVTLMPEASSGEMIVVLAIALIAVVAVFLVAWYDSIRRRRIP
jgi:hypothetical protein